MPLKYKKGDILYVRETWNTTDNCGLFPPWQSTGTHYIYKADASNSDEAKEAKWRSPYHMPRDAARIFLRVTNVRCERVRDITIGDVIAEGCLPSDVMGGQTLDYFRPLWDSLNAKRGYGWENNPWVFAYTFERCEKPEGTT